MNELTLDGKTYVSSKRAAEITGYAKDYVGQLCREGHVEARLVGRNWYVLETSIREHRFGKAAEAASGTQETLSNAASAWEAPRYHSEVPLQIPSLSDRATVNALGDEKTALGSESTSNTPSALTDMQSAWQEWFSMKEAEKASEPVIAMHEVTEPEPEESASEEPVAVYREPVEEEQVEAIYTPETTLDLSHLPVMEESPAEAEEAYEEGIIIEESEVARSSWGIGDLALRSVFVAVSLITIAITVIGTGYGSKFSDFGLSRIPEINMIAGVSVYNHK